MSGKQGVKRFDGRAFVAMVAAASLVALVVSGLGTHASEHGDAAAGYHGWLAAHMLVAVAFTVSAGWHAGLNGRMFLRHAHRREAALACGLVLALVGAGLLHGLTPH